MFELEFKERFKMRYGMPVEEVIEMLFWKEVQDFLELRLGKKVSPERVRCLDLWIEGSITEPQFIEEITDEDD